MDKFKPIYRGKADQLEAQKLEARDWMIGICRRLVADFHDKEISTEVNNMLDELEASTETSNGTGWHNRGFRQEVTRTSSLWGYSNGVTYNDYFYQWNIGVNVRVHYSSQKLVIRKNGTVHEVNLSDALYKWASRIIKERNETDIGGKNREEYEAMQSPGKHESNITIELSKTELGKCSITMSDFNMERVRFGPVRGIPIFNAQAMILKMKATAEQFIDDAGDIRNAQ